MGTIKKRETNKGKVVFDATVRRKGLPSSYRTFKRLTDAKLWIQDIECQARAGSSGTSSLSIGRRADQTARGLQ